MKQVLHIKNMVCNRCIKVVKEELEKLDIQIEDIELGKVAISKSLDTSQTEEVRTVLHDNGFELIDDKKSQLIDRIKTIIIEKTHYSNEGKELVNFSEVIANEAGYDYSYLSKLFSSVEGITIEKYIINQKIEKVKELLVYGELTLNEISYQLGYSSVQHLSNQFKKVTGLTPSHFKKVKENKRKPLDEV
ncbi:AraC family transcriptional regulator [Draconibacterium halophilum]|uniref:Helix-turn-helix domain-containing protein n=1 Tax=Draconibacterium halophilum TaxID=2706887 RepID=A0A6C0RFR0_9BACT|nr:helix-turn-helix domain-containing protein [Draconibacterium halophilum]QIA08363.1 helix-turn-helix domain-containing protein [Draconibacterium halophilum]